MAKYKTMKPTKPGQKPIKFEEGTLKKQLGVSTKKKIPAKTMKSALAGKKGKLVKKRALFKKNVLTGPK